MPTQINHKPEIISPYVAKSWCSLVNIAKDPEEKLAHRIEAYKELMRRHDWDYEYSDDHAVWEDGVNKEIEIREIRADLYPLFPDAGVLYEHYRKGGRP